MMTTALRSSLVEDLYALALKAVVTMGDLRTITVLVVGEVVKPGDYSVSGLATLLNTLITTGGVKRTGSLRNIQLKRRGKTLATLDLYDVLLRGDTSGDRRWWSRCAVRCATPARFHWRRARGCST